MRCFLYKIVKDSEDIGANNCLRLSYTCILEKSCLSDATAQRSHEICRIWDTTLIMNLKYLMREPDTCVYMKSDGGYWRPLMNYNV